MKLLESNAYIADLKCAIKNIDLSSLEGKTIFITGGLGLICSTIADVLLAYGKIKKIYIGARSSKDFQDRFGGFNKAEYVFYDALKPLKLDVVPDYIICVAGLSSPELYTSKPVETILSNFDGVHSLLEYARYNNVKRLLYISSSEVYGNKDSEEPFRENVYGKINIDNIRTSYAVAKRASEMLCKAFGSEFDVNVVMVRPGHIYGPSAKKTDKRISSSFAFEAAAGKKLLMKSAGLQKRSYCYSIDCALQILTVLLNGENGQAYNVGHDEVTTIRRMAEILARAGNTLLLAEKPTELETNAFNPMNNSSLNNEKVKELGYKDTFTVEEGLTHTVEILKEVWNL